MQLREKQLKEIEQQQREKLIAQSKQSGSCASQEEMRIEDSGANEGASQTVGEASMTEKEKRHEDGDGALADVMEVDERSEAVNDVGNGEKERTVDKVPTRSLFAPT